MVQEKIKNILSSILIETKVENPNSWESGASVVSISRSRTTKRDGKLVYLRADISKGKDIEKAVSRIVKDFGKIDVLINCAGVFSQRQIEDISEEEYATVMDTNVKGAFFMSAAVVPYMKNAKEGLIINIGSKISRNTMITPGKVLYATSKYALEGFSLALRNELKSSGIRVTCLMLGTMNTFISLRSKKFLTPENVGFTITMLILLRNVDFESIIMKSNKQFI